MAPVNVALRALSGDGSQEVLGAEPLRVTLDDPDTRVARFVLPAVEAKLGVPVALLGTGSSGAVEVEVLGGRLAQGLGWAEVTPPDDRLDREPWARPGWYRRTCAEIDEALSGIGSRRTGPVRQARHWGISAVMQIPTAAGSLWFKQVPQLFAHEGRLSAFLSELVPGAVPRPVYVGTDWWMSEELAPEVRELTGMEHYGALGVLQRAAAEHAPALLDLGCPDRRPPNLLPELYATGGAVLTPAQWAVLEPAAGQLGRAVEVLVAADLPDTLVHGDFHAGNVRGTAAGWCIYDWTDGCLSHPLLDLQPVWSLRRWAGQAFEAGVNGWWPGLRFGPAVWSAAKTVGLAHQVVSHLRITAGVEAVARPGWVSETGEWADRLIAQLAEAE